MSILHGWPGLRARDLIGLTMKLALRSGLEDTWPAVAHVDYSEWQGAEDGAVVPHPDDGVLLGSVGALATAEYDAVVSLCHVGTEQVRVAAPNDHAEFWLIDGHDNLYTEFTLKNAAETIRQLRADDKRVFLHCVRMEPRTPAVAALYGSLITGSTPLEALERIRKVLPNAEPNSLFRQLLDTNGR